VENINKIFTQNTIYNYNLDEIELKELSIEGNLEANLVVIYTSGELSELATEDRDFLMKMLGAVKYTIENTLLISDKNLISFKQIAHKGFAKKIIFFGSTRKSVNLNLNLKRYKIFNIQNIDCLFVDTIPKIQENQKRKGALWTLMKTMFNI
jgi:hypothetical protein